MLLEGRGFVCVVGTGSGGGMGFAKRHVHQVTCPNTTEVYSAMKPRLQKAGGVAEPKPVNLNKEITVTVCSFTSGHVQ